MSGAAGEADGAGRGALDGDTPTAAPGQCAAPDLAVLLVGVTRVQHQPGVGLVAGDAAPAGQDGLGVRQRGAVQPALAAPGAGDVAEAVVGQGRQGPAGGVRAQDPYRRAVVRGVTQDGPAFQHGTGGPDAVVQVNAERVVPVAQADRQVSAVDAVVEIAPLDASAPVGVAHLQGRGAEASAAFGRVLLAGRAVEAARQARGRGYRRRLMQGQRPAPVHVAQRVVVVQADGIGAGGGVEQPQPAGRVEAHRGHGDPLREVSCERRW